MIIDKIEYLKLGDGANVVLDDCEIETRPNGFRVVVRSTIKTRFYAVAETREQAIEAMLFYLREQKIAESEIEKIELVVDSNLAGSV